MGGSGEIDDEVGAVVLKIGRALVFEDAGDFEGASIELDGVKALDLAAEPDGDLTGEALGGEIGREVDVVVLDGIGAGKRRGSESGDEGRECRQGFHFLPTSKCRRKVPIQTGPRSRL